MIATMPIAQPSAKGMRPHHMFRAATSVASQVPAMRCGNPASAAQVSGVIATVAMTPTTTAPNIAERVGVTTE